MNKDEYIAWLQTLSVERLDDELMNNQLMYFAITCNEVLNSSQRDSLGKVKDSLLLIDSEYNRRGLHYPS